MTQLIDGAISIILNGAVTIPPVMNEDTGSAATSATSKYMDLTEYSPQFQKDIGARDKAIQAVRVEVDQIPAEFMRITLLTKERLNGVATETGPFNLQDADGDGMNWMRAPEARYLAIRVEDLAPQSIWNITAIEFWGHVVGGRQ